MQYATDIGVNLFAALVGFVLGTVYTWLARLWRTRKSRGFWRRFQEGKQILITLPDHSEEHDSLWKLHGLLGFGDVLAMESLRRAIEAVGLSVSVDTDKVGHRNLKEYSIIAIGSIPINATAVALSAEIDKSLSFSFVETDDRLLPSQGVGEKVQYVLDRTCEKRYVPEVDKNGVPVIDYGTIVSAAHPRVGGGCHVMMVGGCWGYGTAAAARLVASADFSRLPVVRNGLPFEMLVSTRVIRGSEGDPEIVSIRALEV